MWHVNSKTPLYTRDVEFSTHSVHICTQKVPHSIRNLADYTLVTTCTCYSEWRESSLGSCLGDTSDTKKTT